MATTINSTGFAPQIAFASKNTSSSAAPADVQVASNPSDGVTLSSGTSSASASAQPTPAQGTSGSPDNAPKLKEWTMLVYFASDNNLYQFEVNNLRDAEKVGSTDQMNVIAQMSHAPDTNTNGGHVVRYEVKKCAAGETSPVKQDLGSINTGDPTSLTDFIKWGKTNYPAKHYALILNDHGNGWQGCLSDDSHDGWFSLPKLEGALKAAREGTDGKPIDVLGFDCCLMANIENAAQMKNEANFMVHSEETEGGPGWTYNQVLSKELLAGADAAMRTREGLSPRDLAAKVVTMAKGHDGDLATMSALDMSKVPTLIDATKSFGQAIKETNVPNADLAAAADASQSFYMESDLFDFANNVAQKSGSDKKLTAAAEAVKSAVEGAMVAEEHSSKYPNAHGMTVELTAQAPGVRPKSINPAPELQRIEFGQYKDLAFQNQTDFNGAVTKFRNSSFAGVAS